MTFRNSIVAGVELIRDAIQSRNFQTGVQGWRIARDGTAEFLTAIIRGSFISGNPTGARVFIDSANSRIQIFDSNNDLVSEIDPTTGISIYDPQGEPDNRIRISTEAGQLTLFLTPGDLNVYHSSRMFTGIANQGLANEYPHLELASPGYADKTDAAFIALRAESDDDTLPCTVAIVAQPDNTDSLIRLQADLVEFSSVTDVDFASAAVNMDSTLTLAGDIATASQNGVNAPATTSGNDDTTSAVYVNMAGTGSVTSFQFVKRYAGTRVKITMAASTFGVTATNVVSIGVLVNGVDTEITRGASLNNEHDTIFGIARITGLPAGTYTIQGRWRRVSGGSVSRRNTDDWLTIDAEEVN
jgi:hypothetical protein